MAYKFVKAKTITLQNYCGYKNVTFDFSDGNGGIKDFAVFFGPNGIGKSSALRALQIAANPVMFKGRERSADLLLRKSVYDEEYIPTVDMMKNAKKNDMVVDVDFFTDQGIKKVVIDNNGIVTNELGYDDCPLNGYTYFADADNPMNTSKFLLSFSEVEKFITFAEEVYGYPCELGMPVDTGIRGYTDFLIKKGPTKVHFKSMSAGEKKIATLISDLCQPTFVNGRDIVIIDNVELHVYFSRHAKMIDKLRETFPNKQIITTTHSSVVINHVSPEYHYDLEKYRPDYKLMEISEEDRKNRLAKWFNSEYKKQEAKCVSLSGLLESGELKNFISRSSADATCSTIKPDTTPISLTNRSSETEVI